MTSDPQPAAESAIAALIYGYAERIDAGDLAGVASLFAQARYRSSGGGEYRGHEAVLRVLTERVILYADGTPRTKHVTTNLLIEVDHAAGGATARAYFTVYQQVDSGPLQAIVAGRYQDRFARDRDTWRFADRLIHVDLIGDLSRHLR
jgi:hypothetical protein